MEYPTILDALINNASQPIIPMHMPGHKRNANGLSPLIPWSLDVTEVGNFDSLHAPKGLLKHAMEHAAKIYRTKRTFFLVNGSTVGLMAAIRAMTTANPKVIIAQNNHMSVYHALELCNASIETILPGMDYSFEVAGSIDPIDVLGAFHKNPDAQLLVITSPTYEGMVSDIERIAEVVHRRGALLLVDEAHGAHFPFSDRFPQSAIDLGADVVVHSLHKTLPSLTQTALLHVASDRVDEAEIQRQLSIFETSSPSFLLMASIDECIRLMARDGEILLAAHSERLKKFSDAVKPLMDIRVRGHGRESGRLPYGTHALDRSKILIACKNGRTLSETLRLHYNIETEMYAAETVLAMSTICDPPETLEALARALIEIDQSGALDLIKTTLPSLPKITQVTSISEALAQPGTALPLAQTIGHISREYVWAYPPGIPLLMPGAIITEELVAYLDELNQCGVTLHSTHKLLPGRLSVC